MNYVYHASPIQNLKRILPKSSTHQKKYIYATTNLSVAALFLGRLGGDFTVGIKMNKLRTKPEIHERFKGALDLRCKNQKGSIYILPGKEFKKEKYLWDQEAISDIPTKPIKEIKINDIKKYLIKLEKENKIKIHLFPKHPRGWKKDKKDLIEKAVTWTNQFGKKTLKQVEEFHPDILEEVKRRLK